MLSAVWQGRETHRDAPMLTFVHVEADGRLSDEFRSYDQLWRNGSAVCEALAGHGMRAGDAFALLMHSHPEFVDCMVGSAMAGTVFVPLDPRISGEKLKFMLDFSDCRGAVVADYALPHLLEIADQLPKLEWVWIVGQATQDIAIPGVAVRSFAAVLDGWSGNEQPLREIDPMSAMQMIFTSGTTGDPKAILSPHGRFMFAASLGATIGLTAEDKPYTGLPLSHSNGQLMTLGNALTMQLPAVISRKFSKSRLWEILAKYNCTTLNLLGGMTTAIFAEPAGRFDRAHNVRFVLSAGMPAAMWQEFADRFGVEIFEFYGTAEGGLLLNPPPDARIGSIGKPPPGTECAVLDEHDNPVADGELGQLCFRNSDGTVAPVEYYRNAGASAEKTQGGWFRSGDIGWRDADGWFYFSHRMGTAIRKNGEFISPSEVERVIAKNASVDDVYVYGVSTAANTPGEREVVAAVVPAPGAFDPANVFASCRRELPRNSIPSFIQVLEEIPKTASEKPQDRYLMELLTTANARVFSANGPAKINLGE
ncbi:MAG: AMP-binding protein [Sphingomonadaceae bacterium]